MSIHNVSTQMGGLGHLLTATDPVVCRPHGMVQVCPRFVPESTDRYVADHIHGFPIPVTPVYKFRSKGPFVMPVTGTADVSLDDCASAYDHDQETSAPHLYQVLLEDTDIRADITATEHALVYRFRFPSGSAPALLVSACEAALSMPDATTVDGLQSFPSGRTAHFHMILNRKPVTRDDIAGGIRFRFRAGVTSLEVRIGISNIDAAQARRNLDRELGGKSFAALVSEGREAWERMLDRIRVSGGTPGQRRTFYSALYRVMTRMQCVSEEGRYFSAYDGTVHTGEPDFYVSDQIWDTFRSAHPLRLLIDPERELNMIRSYVRMHEQSGWLPRFPGIDGDFAAMVGHHTVASIVDAWRKGVSDFDVESAYTGMRKTLTQATRLPWCNGPFSELDRQYEKLGFLPALKPGETESDPDVHPWERRQSVSVTLECSYDAACLARMARLLGKHDDAAMFAQWAQRYRNLYDTRIGFMAPRTADGAWIEGFDPKLSGGNGGRDYTSECNSWVYTWSVMQDVAGLAGLMGGREAMVERLDRLFAESLGTHKIGFLSQFPDSTGLIGQYVAGNEPGFHIPYLYDYAGAPWKTQRRIRQVMDLWFCDGPLGICGDEDGGAMTAWHVFNAMGFFPVCPGEPVYAIGSPVFESIELDLGGGRMFTIRAEGASAKRKYIQQARLNGEPHNKPWFAHDDLRDGAVLHLDMGERPNKEWGSRPEDAPPELVG
jgi:predicted alpha-1,2-mannosidase